MGRLSIVHLVKHFSPFKNSFTPSRRQSLQTGPVYLAINPPDSLDASSFRWAAAIVGYRRDVGYGHHLDTSSLQRADCGLAAGARALDKHFDLAQPVLHGAACRTLGG